MLNYSRVGKLFLMLGSLGILGVFSATLFIGDFKMRENKAITLPEGDHPLGDNFSNKNNTDDVPELASAVQEVINQTQDIVRTSSFGENATNKLATSIAKEIIALNPSGPGSGDLQKLNIVNPNEVVDRLTASAIKNFDPSEFRPHVSPANFKIVEDSKVAFESYLKGFFVALRSNFLGLNIGAEASLSPAEANKMLDAYDKALAGLSKLEVPKSLIFIHQQELSLVMGQKKMFQMVAEYSRDPLQALLAINAGEGLEKDFKAVGKEIMEFVKVNDLTL